MKFAKTKLYFQRLLHLDHKPDNTHLIKVLQKFEELQRLESMLRSKRVSRQQLQSDMLQDQAVMAVRAFSAGLAG